MKRERLNLSPSGRHPEINHSLFTTTLDRADVHAHRRPEGAQRSHQVLSPQRATNQLVLIPLLGARPRLSCSNREERRPRPGGGSSSPSFDCSFAMESKYMYCHGDEHLKLASSFLTPVVTAGALENGPFLSKTGRKGQGGLAAHPKANLTTCAVFQFFSYVHWVRKDLGDPCITSQSTPHTREHVQFHLSAYRKVIGYMVFLKKATFDGTLILI